MLGLHILFCFSGYFFSSDYKNQDVFSFQARRTVDTTKRVVAPDGADRGSSRGSRRTHIWYTYSLPHNLYVSKYRFHQYDRRLAHFLSYFVLLVVHTWYVSYG